MKWFENLGLIAIVLISWGIALFEYMFSGTCKQDWVQGKWRSIFTHATQSSTGSNNIGGIYGIYTRIF